MQMRDLFWRVCGLTFAVGLALAPAPASAASGGGLGATHAGSAVQDVANWRQPYSNVDPRWDRGNDTGDWMTDRLNAQQLGGNYGGPYYPAPPPYPPPPDYYGRPPY